MRRLLGALITLLCLTACTPHAPRAAAAPATGTIRIVAKPLPLNPSDPKQSRVGAFVFAGALQLTTPDSSLLGGLSDLKLIGDDRLVSESDEGTLLRAHIVLGPDGRLVGLDQATLTPLTGMDGKPLPGKWESDAEGVAVWPNGDLMVSFEHDHRIWIYPAAGGPPRIAPMPNAKMPKNAGMEGLALAPREGADAYWVGLEGGSIWLCHLASDCKQTPGQHPPPFGSRLPALFEMDDGDLVVEHHHWDPLTGNRLTIDVIDNPAANAAPRLKAQLALGPPLTLDNIEGVAVVARPGGVQRFYLITDDNFEDNQRTLLMAFDWTPAPTAKAAAK